MVFCFLVVHFNRNNYITFGCFRNLEKCLNLQQRRINEEFIQVPHLVKQQFNSFYGKENTHLR
jgi:hypothetical protein